VARLIRNSLRPVARRHAAAVAAGLRAIYTAPSDEAALDALAASEPGRKYPQAARVWEDAWEAFTPFLAFTPGVRKLLYTTNSIESLNYQLRKVTKARGHFPGDDAVVKLLWLAIINIEDKRARERAACAAAPFADLGPGQGDGTARRHQPGAQHAGVLLRPALALAAPDQREHQRAAAPVLILNLALVAGLLAVGVTAHSLAVLAEGSDYLLDAAGVGVALFAIHLSARPASRTRPQGYPNATSIAALVNCGWLLVLEVLVALAAVDRLVTHTPQVHGLPV